MSSWGIQKSAMKGTSHNPNKEYNSYLISPAVFFIFTPLEHIYNIYTHNCLIENDTSIMSFLPILI